VQRKSIQRAIKMKEGETAILLSKNSKTVHTGTLHP
jgi:hypothetical protein